MLALPPASTGEERPAPAQEERPAPAREERPVPAEEERPAPAREERPAPAAEAAIPRPASPPAAAGVIAIWDPEDPAIFGSRTRPSRMGIPRPPVRVPAPRSNLPRPVPRPPTRFGLVNRWDGLGYTPHGGHLRWLPEPAKDLVREGWECLPTPAKSVTVAVWRTGRAVRRRLWTSVGLD